MTTETSTTCTDLQTTAGTETSIPDTTSQETIETTVTETTTAPKAPDTDPNIIGISVGVTLAALLVIVIVTVLLVLAKRGKLCQRKSGRKAATSTLQHPDAIDQYNRNSEREGVPDAATSNPYHLTSNQNGKSNQCEDGSTAPNRHGIDTTFGSESSTRPGTPGISGQNLEDEISRSGMCVRPHRSSLEYPQSKPSHSEAYQGDDQFTPDISRRQPNRDKCCAGEQSTRNPKHNTYQNFGSCLELDRDHDRSDICKNCTEDAQTQARQPTVDSGQDTQPNYVNLGVVTAGLVEEDSSDEHIYNNCNQAQSYEDDCDEIYRNIQANNGDQFKRAIDEELYINHETARSALNIPSPSEVRTENTPLRDTSILRRTGKDIISQMPPYP